MKVRWYKAQSNWSTLVLAGRLNFFRNGSPRWRLPRHPVVVRVGKPFELASSDHKDNAVQVMQAISDVLVTMGDEPAVRGLDVE